MQIQSLGNSLLNGRFPSVDQYGNLLKGERAAKSRHFIAGGWRGGFEAWCGDWKERSLSHNFVKRNYQSTMLCDQCGAVNPHAKTPERLLPYVYSNFDEDAPWKQTLRNHAGYLQETPLHLQTPWLAIPGFDISRVRWDSAHTILLGIGKDIAASFLCDLVSRLVLQRMSFVCQTVQMQVVFNVSFKKGDKYISLTHALSRSQRFS